MSNPTENSPKSKRNNKKLPGKDGNESSRKTVGGRHGPMGAGKKKFGPGTGKNQGDGLGA